MIDGMVLLSKPEGVTSFRALGALKKTLSTKKVGHTGTLDKFATGLMVVLTGKMTKFAPYITGMDKEYEAVFRFGETTETLDPEGEVTEEAPVPTLEEIEKAVKEKFTGKIMQIPPDFSAVHIGGQRAYQLKLQGKEVKIPPREVDIQKYEILSWDGRDLKVRVACSKGTYIRSLARDLARETGSAAYVLTLHRTKVGMFTLEGALSPDDFQKENLISSYGLMHMLDNVETAYVKEAAVSRIKNGQPFKASYFTNEGYKKFQGKVGLFTETRDFLALVERKGPGYTYCFVAGGS